MPMLGKQVQADVRSKVRSFCAPAHHCHAGTYARHADEIVGGLTSFPDQNTVVRCGFICHGLALKKGHDAEMSIAYVRI